MRQKGNRFIAFQKINNNVGAADLKIWFDIGVMISQKFFEDMCVTDAGFRDYNRFIANASGCSSAFGGSTPGTPYRKDKFGCGPTWAMSLFEDCAEYAYGMMLGSEKIRKTLKAQVEELAGLGVCRAECEAWLENMENREASIDTTAKLVAAQKLKKSRSIRLFPDARQSLRQRS